VLGAFTTRHVIRAPFHARLVDDCDARLAPLLTDRDLMAHRYDDFGFETVVGNVRPHYLVILGAPYERLGAEALES